MARNAPEKRSRPRTVSVSQAAEDAAIKLLRKQFNGVLIFPDDLVKFAERFAQAYIFFRVPKRYRAFRDDRPIGRPMGTELVELFDKLAHSDFTEQIGEILAVRYGPRFRDWIKMIIKNPRYALLLFAISKSTMDKFLQATDFFQPVSNMVYKNEMEKMYDRALASALLLIPMIAKSLHGSINTTREFKMVNHRIRQQKGPKLRDLDPNDPRIIHDKP